MTQSRLFSIIFNIENQYNKLMTKYWAYVLCAAGLNFFSGQIVINLISPFHHNGSPQIYCAPGHSSGIKSIEKCDTFVIKCDEDGR
jgi:hypothetical protein